jgi:hypothetical protein
MGNDRGSGQPQENPLRPSALDAADVVLPDQIKIRRKVSNAKKQTTDLIVSAKIQENHGQPEIR